MGAGAEDGVMPIHALVIQKDGVVQEMHCESTWNYDPETGQLRSSYDFTDRQTGSVIPHRQDQGNHSHATTAEASTGTTAASTMETAKELAKTFYGLEVPPFLEQLTRQPGDGLPRLLNTRVGEALWHHDHKAEDSTW